MLQIKKTNNFYKQFKKLHKNQKTDLDKAIMMIAKNPEIGKAKVGDLSGVFVYKFKMVNQLTLLAYQYDEKKLYLLSIGSHQNFYKNLKKL